MPIFDFVCDKCNSPIRTMNRTLKEHKDCGGKLVRKAEGASSQQYDTIDNGLMSRKLERLTNVEELAYERTKDDPRNTTRFSDS